MRWRPLVIAAAVLGLVTVDAFQSQDRTYARHWTVVAKSCVFTPARLEANRNDIVRVEFVAADAPYSFVIDAYRIAKRATPGHPVRFEFVAITAGTFDFYSDLRSENGCADVRGALVVADTGGAGDS